MHPPKQAELTQLSTKMTNCYVVATMASSSHLPGQANSIATSADDKLAV
jgi:hypothetical protein